MVVIAKAATATSRQCRRFPHNGVAEFYLLNLLRLPARLMLIPSSCFGISWRENLSRLAANGRPASAQFLGGRFGRLFRSLAACPASTFVIETARYEPQDYSEFARLQRRPERHCPRQVGEALMAKPVFNEAIVACFTEIHSRLFEAAQIAKAAEASASAGSRPASRKAFRSRWTSNS